MLQKVVPKRHFLLPTEEKEDKKWLKPSQMPGVGGFLQIDPGSGFCVVFSSKITGHRFL